MEIFIILVGIFITIIAGIFIIFGKKGEKNITGYELNELELEYRDLKNEILELTREFNRTASYNTNILDEKIAYLLEIREDIDEKILKLTKLMTDIEILYNRYEKNLKAQPLLSNSLKIETIKENSTLKKNNIEFGKNSFNNEVIDMFNMGMSISEISIKTGRSISEIEFIIGVMRKE